MARSRGLGDVYKRQAVFLPVACGLLLDQQRMLMAMVRELQDRPCPHCKAEP
jgi:hypothetical protein